MKKLAIAFLSGNVYLGFMNAGKGSFIISSKQYVDKKGSCGRMNWPDYISSLMYPDAKDG